jgi:hypothetical protein
MYDEAQPPENAGLEPTPEITFISDTDRFKLDIVRHDTVVKKRQWP